jgi:hypothetical protein
MNIHVFEPTPYASHKMGTTMTRTTTMDILFHIMVETKNKGQCLFCCRYPDKECELPHELGFALHANSVTAPLELTR